MAFLDTIPTRPVSNSGYSLVTKPRVGECIDWNSNYRDIMASQVAQHVMISDGAMVIPEEITFEINVIAPIGPVYFY